MTPMPDVPRTAGWRSRRIFNSPAECLKRNQLIFNWMIRRVMPWHDLAVSNRDIQHHSNRHALVAAAAFVTCRGCDMPWHVTTEIIRHDLACCTGKFIHNGSKGCQHPVQRPETPLKRVDPGWQAERPCRGMALQNFAVMSSASGFFCFCFHVVLFHPFGVLFGLVYPVFYNHVIPSGFFCLVYPVF